MCMCEREGKRAALTLVRAHCPCCCTHPPGTYMREGLCCLPPFPPRRAGKQEEYGAGSPLRGPAALPPSLPSEGRGRLGEVDEEGAEEDQEHKQEDADGAQLDPHGDLGTRSPDVLRVLVQLQPDLVDPLLKALDEGVLALKLLADRGAQVVELVKPERDQVKLLVLLLPSAFPILRAGPGRGEPTYLPILIPPSLFPTFPPSPRLPHTGEPQAERGKGSEQTQPPLSTGSPWGDREGESRQDNRMTGGAGSP
mmetsp:Transcript_14748/g.35116  ORF Transcript_14748/g.35116 Transcript_14748/m.35116 type:complete len:253 (-) Transcript_14748:1451-2209(-)